MQPPRPERVANLPLVELADYCDMLRAVVRQSMEDGVFNPGKSSLREQAWLYGSESTQALEESLTLLKRENVGDLPHEKLAEHAYTLEGVVCYFVAQGKLNLFGQGIRTYARENSHKQAEKMRKFVFILMGRYSEMTAPGAIRRTPPPPQDFS